MTVGLFNPALVKPDLVLDPSQLKRAAALLVARQVLVIIEPVHLVEVAEYICTGLIPAAQLPWTEESAPQLFADGVPIKPTEP